MSLTLDLFSRVLETLTRESLIPGDKRSEARIELRAAAVFIPLQNEGLLLKTDVRITDISPSGIGLIREEPLAIGDTFAILVPGEGAQPLGLLYTTQNCAPMGGSLYRIGAHLLRGFDVSSIEASAAEIARVAMAA